MSSAAEVELPAGVSDGGDRARSYTSVAVEHGGNTNREAGLGVLVIGAQTKADALRQACQREHGVDVDEPGARGAPVTDKVGLVLSCDCARRTSSDASTWTDPFQWARVPSASLEDLTSHRVFAPDTALDVNVRPEVTEAARAVWQRQREHLDPIDVDYEIRAAADARRDAEQWPRLADWAARGPPSGLQPG